MLVTSSQHEHYQVPAEPPPPPPQIVVTPTEIDQLVRKREAERAALERAEREADEQKWLDAALWVYAGTAGADWAVTSVCYQVACSDGKTQTGLFLHGVKPEAAVPLGIAIDAAVLGLAKYVLGPDHPKLTMILLHAASAARVSLTIRHVNYLRQHAIIRPIP
jgi:hypothetical protein